MSVEEIKEKNEIDDNDNNNNNEEENDGDYTNNCVIDAGSGTIKAGFVGDNQPRVVFPSIVGRIKHKGLIGGADIHEKEVYIGEEAHKKREILSVKYPIENGIVTNWEDMEVMWQYIFDTKLQIDPTESSILLSETLPGPKINRETLTQVMFEKFHTKQLYLASQSTLSVYASGRTIGIVCDSGYRATYIQPVYESYPLPHAALRLDLGGQNITEYLQQSLSSQGYTFITSNEQDALQDMKEKNLYVALDYESELRKVENSVNDFQRPYELPDGRIITLSAERFRCTEVLFQPKLCKSEQDGIGNLIYQSIMKCDTDVRRDFYSNIILAGGSSMFEGLAERLQHEVAQQAPRAIKVKVIAAPERKYSAWIGGSILGALDTFVSMYISQAEYQESGPSIVHRKCF